MNKATRPVRAILGIAILSIIFFMVLAWVLDYRGGDDGTVSDVPDVETTATVTPEGEEPEGESSPPPEAESDAAKPVATVVVLVDGLNFRKEPSGGADLIKGLAEGAELELIATEDGWHKVKDADGNIGYVSASDQYTKLKQ